MAFLVCWQFEFVTGYEISFERFEDDSVLDAWSWREKCCGVGFGAGGWVDICVR